MQHVSKNEKLFARVEQRNGRLSSNERVLYFPIVVYSDGTYYFLLDGQLEKAEKVGYIDHENNTFKLLGGEMVYEDGRLLSEGKFIQLKSLEHIECNKFGQVN